MYIFRVLHMAMKFMQVGFRPKNLQYTTGAGPSAQENSGVGCASPSIVSNIEDFAIFRDGTAWGESTVERGFGRKVAPGGAITGFVSAFECVYTT